MKRQWTREELAEHWTLAPAELALLANKAGATRLGIASREVEQSVRDRLGRSVVREHLGPLRLRMSSGRVGSPTT